MNEANSATRPAPDPHCPTCGGVGTFRRVDAIELCPCAERRARRAEQRVQAVFRDAPTDSLFDEF